MKIAGWRLSGPPADDQLERSRPRFTPRLWLIVTAHGLTAQALNLVDDQLKHLTAAPPNLVDQLISDLSGRGFGSHPPHHLTSDYPFQRVRWPGCALTVCSHLDRLPRDAARSPRRRRRPPAGRPRCRCGRQPDAGVPEGFLHDLHRHPCGEHQRPTGSAANPSLADSLSASIRSQHDQPTFVNPQVKHRILYSSPTGWLAALQPRGGLLPPLGLWPKPSPLSGVFPRPVSDGWCTPRAAR